MLVNTTARIVGALLGIGSTNNYTASSNAAANSAASNNNAASSNAAAWAGTVPLAPSAQPPVAADTAAAPLPPLGEAARFDISPEGLRAAQLSATAFAFGTAPVSNASTRSAAPVPQPSDFGDEAAARAWAIASQDRESSMGMIIRIAKLADRPWPTDKAAESARQSDSAEKTTLAVA